MEIRTARIYEPPAGGEGFRVLVDRLWPRGLRKEQVRVDAWVKELAPSGALRTWFAHDVARWRQFRERYARELEGKEDQIAQLIAQAGERPIVLLYGAKDKEHNQALVLKEFLEAIAARKRRRAPAAVG